MTLRPSELWIDATFSPGNKAVGFAIALRHWASNYYCVVTVERLGSVVTSRGASYEKAYLCAVRR